MSGPSTFASPRGSKRRVKGRRRREKKRKVLPGVEFRLKIVDIPFEAGLRPRSNTKVHNEGYPSPIVRPFPALGTEWNNTRRFETVSSINVPPTLLHPPSSGPFHKRISVAVSCFVPISIFQIRVGTRGKSERLFIGKSSPFPTLLLPYNQPPLYSRSTQESRTLDIILQTQLHFLPPRIAKSASTLEHRTPRYFIFFIPILPNIAIPSH